MGKFKTVEKENLRKESTKTEAQINRLFSKISQGLMEIYVLFYLGIFPLCMHDKYFDIMGFRFDLFWKPTFVYGVIFLFLGLLYIMCDALYNKSAIRLRFFKNLQNLLSSSDNEENLDVSEYINELNKSSQKNIKNKWNNNKINKLLSYLHLSVVDVVMSLLILLFSISTILSDYPYEAFWGDRGRNQGLLIWIMFFVAYVLITRFYKFKKWHIWYYMIFASLVCIWGILNFFLLTFGMFENANETYKYMFVSSIGNINTYTNYTGILFGISSALFISSDKPLESFFSYVVLFIAGFAQIMGLSDNAILSTGIVLMVAPLLLWKNYGTMTRYFSTVATYLSAMKITSLITLSGIETMNDLDPSVQITMAGKSIFAVFLSMVYIVTVVFWLAAMKERNYKETEVSCVSGQICLYKRAWYVLLSVGSLAIVVIIFLANNGIYSDFWEPYSNMLVFNDSWGTGRGLCWRLGMEYWTKDATLLKKLFGYGPDTFFIITMDRFMNIMQEAGYGMFDSAHNEYFEYFITVGIFGLAAYSSVLYFSLRNMFQSINSYSKCIGIGVLAYAFQAVVNIAIPITTPVFMIMMYVGLVSCKDKQKI